MFSMFSMLAMQLFCTLLHASRMNSQKLRCPSELNQLPEPAQTTQISDTVRERNHDNSPAKYIITPVVDLPAGYCLTNVRYVA